MRKFLGRGDQHERVHERNKKHFAADQQRNVAKETLQIRVWIRDKMSLEVQMKEKRTASYKKNLKKFKN